MLSRFARLPEASSVSIRCFNVNINPARNVNRTKLAMVTSSSNSNKRDFHTIKTNEMFPRHKFNHRLSQRTSGSLRMMSDKAEPETVQAEVVDEESNVNAKEDYKPVSSGNEAAKGDTAVHEFQAETRKLLDIVAKSLYSEKEVFIRELVSNASDAIEKKRYLSMTGEGGLVLPEGAQGKLQIDINTDKMAKTITISDTGVGMTKEEMIENLGTIARSGSKAFMQEMEAKQAVDPKDIIGQFGVGFYSAFMVADRIEVFSKSSVGKAFHWESDGAGTYKVREAEGVANGTKIVVHLRDDCQEFADEARVRDVVKKYSSFVGADIYLNGTKSNELRPLWLMDPKEVTPDMHENFYRYVANAFDKPRFTYHFRTEAPIDMRAVFYVPETRPGIFEMQRQASTGGDVGVSLYCRKVLILSKAEKVVPHWMRFVKGVVDSEDIPLNLSRELLQDSAQIRRLRTVVTNKFLRFMQERARKETKSFMEFYKDYGFFFKEGILMAEEQAEKEELAKLLRFESSSKPEGEMVTLPEYCDRMAAGQRDIYYLAAPSRQLAESSPYYESMKKKDAEVLFCYESYDELVLMQLGQFNRLKMTSVEKEFRQESSDSKTDAEESADRLSVAEQDDLTNWLKTLLGQKAAKVKTTSRLESHPCVITLEEMAAARHFIKTQGANFTEEQRYNILQPQLEFNPAHPVMKKLANLKTSNPKLAGLVAEQLFANAMVSAGLVEDPRTVLKNMNELLEEALAKH